MNALTLAASYGMKFSFGKVRHVQSITKITSHTQMICEICHALSTLFQPPPLRSERLYVTFHSVFSYFYCVFDSGSDRGGGVRLRAAKVKRISKIHR